MRPAVRPVEGDDRRWLGALKSLVLFMARWSACHDATGHQDLHFRSQTRSSEVGGWLVALEPVAVSG